MITLEDKQKLTATIMAAVDRAILELEQSSSPVFVTGFSTADALGATPNQYNPPLFSADQAKAPKIEDGVKHLLACVRELERDLERSQSQLDNWCALAGKAKHRANMAEAQLAQLRAQLEDATNLCRSAEAQRDKAIDESRHLRQDVSVLRGALRDCVRELLYQPCTNGRQHLRKLALKAAHCALDQTPAL